MANFAEIAKVLVNLPGSAREVHGNNEDVHRLIVAIAKQAREKKRKTTFW